MPRKPKAKLYLRFRMPDGKQSPYYPALFDNKSRIRPFWCLVKGTPEHHPEATYYKRVKREGKWGWESLGTDANTAAAKVSAANVSFPDSPKVPDKPETPTAKDGYRIDSEIAVYPSGTSTILPMTPPSPSNSCACLASERGNRCATMGFIFCC